MPLDNPGARAPLSPHAQRLARLKLLRRRARTEDRKRRALTASRVALVEMLLAKVIDGADLLGESDMIYGSGHDRGTVFLLVTMKAGHFGLLCETGAELQDDEDTDDAERTEADDGEHDLGWSENFAQHLSASADEEYSLGSLGMIDQRNWSDGQFPGWDLERDDAEREPSLGAQEGKDWCTQEDWADGDRTDREENIGPQDRELADDATAG